MLADPAKGMNGGNIRRLSRPAVQIDQSIL
jgi:hypothetical protein